MVRPEYVESLTYVSKKKIETTQNEYIQIVKLTKTKHIKINNLTWFAPKSRTMLLKNQNDWIIWFISEKSNQNK